MFKEAIPLSSVIEALFRSHADRHEALESLYSLVPSVPPCEIAHAWSRLEFLAQ